MPNHQTTCISSLYWPPHPPVTILVLCDHELVFNWDITDELRMLFEKFGPIKECKVMVDKNTGMSRQLGFVR
jgi:hypothetical protein